MHLVLHVTPSAHRQILTNFLTLTTPHWHVFKKEVCGLFLSGIRLVLSKLLLEKIELANSCERFPSHTKYTHNSMSWEYFVKSAAPDKFSWPFESNVHVFMGFWDSKGLTSYVGYWTLTQPHSCSSTSCCWMPPPQHHYCRSPDSQGWTDHFQI
jgi:hypothetical protein